MDLRRGQGQKDVGSLTVAHGLTTSASPLWLLVGSPWVCGPWPGLRPSKR